jgi:hypothetical protein
MVGPHCTAHLVQLSYNVIPYEEWTVLPILLCHSFYIHSHEMIRPAEPSSRLALVGWRRSTARAVFQINIHAFRYTKLLETTPSMRQQEATQSLRFGHGIQATLASLPYRAFS